MIDILHLALTGLSNLMKLILFAITAISIIPHNRGLLFGQTSSQLNNGPDVIDVSKFDDSIRHWMNEPGRRFPYQRFDRSQFVGIADNLLRLQNLDGGWPKNVDWLGKLDRDLVFSKLTDLEKSSTCDNRNTYSQIEYLAKVYARTGMEKYRNGAGKGIEFLLASQNASGGWRGADVDAITFNDDLMTGIMNLLMDIVKREEHFTWVSGTDRMRVRSALDQAVSVTLKCQIVVDGRKTGWCQQHDHRSLKPIRARSYELPSITAMETSGVIEFLLRLENPEPAVVTAIQAAVDWLKRSEIPGIRLKRLEIDSIQELSEAFKRYEVVGVSDQNAPPIWARYYEIESNRPFFCNRDGIKVYSLAEVGRERRIGYQWYGYWPQSILKEKYPQWLKSRTAKLRE